MLTIGEEVRDLMLTPGHRRCLSWKFKAENLLPKLKEKIERLESDEQFIALYKMYKYQRTELTNALHELNKLL